LERERRDDELKEEEKKRDFSLHRGTVACHVGLRRGVEWSGAECVLHCPHHP
jgi:hypothetical protein